MKIEPVLQVPLFTGATAVYPWVEYLAKRFTFVDRFDTEVKMWQRSGDRIRVPRAYCPLSDDDRRVEGARIKLTSTFEPRNTEQTRVVDEATGLLKSGESFVLQATTGFGKTACACEIIKRVGRKTLVIVPKSDLMEQWRGGTKKKPGGFAKFLPGASVGTIRQDKYDVAGRDVVIGMLQSLSKKGRYPKSMLNEFGLVIWDEVHRIPADTFSQTAVLFPALLRMGLSATPKRRDGRDLVIWGHIGPVRVETALQMMKPKVARYSSLWKCPVWRHQECLGKGCKKCGGTGKVKAAHTAGKCGHILNDLVKCRSRNELLAHLIAAGYPKGRNTVVFSDRVDHLTTLRAMVLRAGVPQSETVLYVSSATKKDKENMPAKRVIFATYGMMSEGTDVEWLDVAVFATPRANVKQAMGRVVREWEGKPQPVCIDIVDSDSDVFAGYARARLRTYSQVGADVVQYRRTS